MELNLPKYQVKLKKEADKHFIFDDVRKKYLVLTPEEWVRQHFIHFLQSDKKVPLSIMSIERELQYGKLKKRTDIVVYGSDGQPKLIVECKAPHIKISQDVFDQIARYNMVLKVNYIAVTNGIQHYYCKIDHQKNNYTFIEELPNFDEY